MRTLATSIGIGSSNTVHDSRYAFSCRGDSLFSGSINVSNGAVISGVCQITNLTATAFRTSNVYSNGVISNTANVSYLACTNTFTCKSANCQSVESNSVLCKTFACSSQANVSALSCNTILSNNATFSIGMRTSLCTANVVVSNVVTCNTVNALNVNTIALFATTIVSSNVTTPSFTCPIVTTNSAVCDTLDVGTAVVQVCNAVSANVQSLVATQCNVRTLNVSNVCTLAQLNSANANITSLVVSDTIVVKNLSSTMCNTQRLYANTISTPIAFMANVMATTLSSGTGNFTTNLSSLSIQCTSLTGQSIDSGIITSNTATFQSFFTSDTIVSNSLRVGGTKFTVDAQGNVDYSGTLSQNSNALWVASPNTVTFAGKVVAGNLDVSGPALLRSSLTVGSTVLSGGSVAGRLGIGMTAPRSTLDIGSGTLTCGSINVQSSTIFGNNVSFNGVVSFSGPMNYSNITTFNSDIFVNSILNANNIITPFVMTAGTVSATTYIGLPEASIVTRGVLKLSDDMTSTSVLTAATSRIVSEIGTATFASKALVDSIISTPSFIQCATAQFSGQSISVNGESITGNYGFTTGGGQLYNKNDTFTLNSNRDAAYSSLVFAGDTSNATVTLQNREDKLKIFNSNGNNVGSISMIGDIAFGGNASLGGGSSGCYMKVVSSMSTTNVILIPMTPSMFVYIFAKGTNKSANMIVSINGSVLSTVSGPYLYNIGVLTAQVIQSNIQVTTDFGCVLSYNIVGV